MVVRVLGWLLWLGLGMGVGGFGFSGLDVGLCLVRNGSIGLVVRSPSCVWLWILNLVLGLVMVCGSGNGLWLGWVGICGSEPRVWCEHSSVFHVNFFLSIPVSVFLSR